MRIGLLGKRRCGKSTVFRALCGSSHIEAKSGASIGRIAVPDWRIDRLAEIYQPERVVNVTVDCLDLEVLVESDSGLDGKTAAKLRETDALTIVIGAFAANDTDSVVTELRAAVEELMLQDQILVENALERIKKVEKNSTNEKILMRCKLALESGELLAEIPWSAQDHQFLAPYRFLSMKPVLALVNETEERCNKTEYPGLDSYCRSRHVSAFHMTASFEEELSRLPVAEQTPFLTEMGFQESARSRFLAAAYSSMDLISFFTVGKDEVRAWPIRRDTIAVDAAGKIHSDIQRGFIRAELMRCEDLLELRSENKVKESGKWRLVGKDYVIQDGDVVSYRFHV